jgi:hypothetical protein
LLGGSGGGGAQAGGGGGGGAILIAASGTITVNGTVNASGGYGQTTGNYASAGSSGSGSGGAIRLVATSLAGNGIINANGGASAMNGGTGRVRIDTYENDFGGNINASFTKGFQPIIIPSAGQLSQLTVTSIGGVPVSASPTGVLTTPDAVVAAQQSNPISVLVSCVNVPLNSLITVSVQPMNASTVSATGHNNTGTLSSSTAMISINILRGGGIIYATASTSN